MLNGLHTANQKKNKGTSGGLAYTHTCLYVYVYQVCVNHIMACGLDSLQILKHLESLRLFIEVWSLPAMLGLSRGLHRSMNLHLDRVITCSYAKKMGHNVHNI